MEESMDISAGGRRRHRRRHYKRRHQRTKYDDDNMYSRRRHRRHHHYRRTKYRPYMPPDYQIYRSPLERSAENMKRKKGGLFNKIRNVLAAKKHRTQRRESVYVNQKDSNEIEVVRKGVDKFGRFQESRSVIKTAKGKKPVYDPITGRVILKDKKNGVRPLLADDGVTKIDYEITVDEGDGSGATKQVYSAVRLPKT